MRGKIKLTKRGGRKSKIKIRYLGLALAVCGASGISRPLAQAESCPDVRLVFARGSGEVRETDQNYLSWKSSIEEKLKTTSLKYDFMDLDYPAVGINDIGVLLGAAISAGESYAFGDSVNAGVSKLITMINSGACPNTKYVIGGYSQGAMVVSRAIPNLMADRVVYAATFGDPKIYLPEGAGIIPPACRGENLSDYRMYVPDCQAYKGLLGSYEPYEPEALIGKLGTWCNKGDIFCSSHFNISNHVAYVADGLYEDASKVIFDKTTKAFGIENHISSMHDTAILIDSTGSMASMIDKYKAEALRLAKETLDSGGRVALYDYRDLRDPYEPKERCNFETCTLEVFTNELNSINASSGGDIPESLLSASFHMMQNLTWKRGATKSVVVLTDANFLSPDRDGITYDQVVALSKSIDPVSFYIITNPEYEADYLPLANDTGGKVVTNFDELSLLTDYIMDRYDSLPRVEETGTDDMPALTVTNVDELSSTEAKISFDTDAEQVIVVVNDAVLGTTTEREITISGLRGGNVMLVPLKNDVRGDGAVIELGGYGFSNILVPLAPDTGRA